MTNRDASNTRVLEPWIGGDGSLGEALVAKDGTAGAAVLAPEEDGEGGMTGGTPGDGGVGDPVEGDTRAAVCLEGGLKPGHEVGDAILGADGLSEGSRCGDDGGGVGGGNLAGEGVL